MVTTRKDYGIETYLRKRSTEAAPLYERYKIHRSHLEPIYSYWAEGFPSGNDHGWGHIERVLEKLDFLLSDGRIKKVSLRELYLAMVSILYHDWGILRERKRHAEIGAELLAEAEHGFNLFTDVERDIVVAAVASHTSKADIDVQTRGLPLEVNIAGDLVRPRTVAALVRLSDELDEDERRAPDRAATIKQLGPASQFYWRFCQCVSGVRPRPALREIQFNVRFEPDDLMRLVEVDGVRQSFMHAFGAKVEKINAERRIVARFLPAGLAFDRIVISLSGVKGIKAMNRSRTVILDDQSTAGEFTRAIPELVNHLYHGILLKSLGLALEKRYNQARKSLSVLEEIQGELPEFVRLRAWYDLACFSCRMAEYGPGTSRQIYTEDAILYLQKWLNLGASGVWESNALLPENEVYRMVRDSDLHYLVFERRPDLLSLLPSTYHRLLPPEEQKAVYGGGGGGCLVRGTAVLTAGGSVPVESLREGDVLLASEYDADGIGHSRPVRLSRVATHRGREAIRINGSLLVSGGQPIQCSDGSWRHAVDLQAGSLAARPGRLSGEKIGSVWREQGYFEFFDLSIEASPHAFVAGNFICHNKMLGSEG